MSDIKINIVGEFNKKGFVQADKATINLSNNFDKLRRSAARTFTAILGYRALKESVKAFAANDAAIQNLTKSLDNLGFRFEAPGLVTYLENLEKATAVSKDELFPAFHNLANATLDVQQSQELLATALDISAATGAQLGSVTNALTRAYNGNFSSLGKIQNAYTMAELKAMGFSESVRVLQDQFSGQAAAAANTYQAKIERLNLALGDAAEAIGEGVIDALEALGDGDYEQGLELIATAGEKVGDAFRFAAKGVAYFQRFWKQGLFATNDQLAEFRRDMDGMFREDPARSRTQLRERAKYLAVEQRQTAKIRKDREAAAKLAEKEKKNQLALIKARATFDLEKIQIEAALKGKINEEERLRLLLMKAIENEDAKRAEALAEKLKELQDRTEKLATALITLDAGDPFATASESLNNLINKVYESAYKFKLKDAGDPFITALDGLTTLTTEVDELTKRKMMLSLETNFQSQLDILNSIYDRLFEIRKKESEGITPPSNQNPMPYTPPSLPDRGAQIDPWYAVDFNPSDSFSGISNENTNNASNNVSITVNGALDPYSVARQIAEVLDLEATTSGSFGALGYSRAFGIS